MKCLGKEKVRLLTESEKNEGGRELRILILKNIKAGKDKELRENTEGSAKV